MEEVFPKIFRETEPKYMANVYYIDDVKKIQIDAGLVLDKPVDVLILTHCHFDHIKYAAEIKKRNPKCEIAASEEAWVHIKNMDEVTCAYMAKENVDKFKVDIILNNGAQIMTGTYKLKVIKVPGHTSGDIALYDNQSKIMFTGDTWFGGDTTGRWDLPTGNKIELKSSIKKLMDLKITNIFAGHQY